MKIPVWQLRMKQKRIGREQVMCQEGGGELGLEEVIPATVDDVLSLLQHCYHEACIIWFCVKSKRSTRMM